mgnify:CR=1 FL=1
MNNEGGPPLARLKKEGNSLFLMYARGAHTVIILYSLFVILLEKFHAFSFAELLHEINQVVHTLGSMAL